MNSEEFNLMKDLYKVDQSLVNGLISTLSYFDFMLFNWTMRSTFDEYNNRAKIDKDSIDLTYRTIIKALHEVPS